MSLKKSVTLAVAVCLGTGALVGCGESGSDEPFEGKNADKIAADAVQATRDAKSVRMAGSVKQQDGSTIQVDFRVDEQDNCTGTLSGQGTKAEIIQTSQSAYVRGDAAFWKNSLKGQPDADKAMGKLQGKWVKAPANEGGLQGMCDKQAFLAAMDGDKSERKGMKKGETTSVDGKKALNLEKKQPGGEKLTLFVATEGKPHILKSVSQGGKTPGEMVFTEYDKKVDAQEPPSDEVVDPKTDLR
ncbi:hypothetical protein [Streptomyces albipurpureus]|uniref:Lipoprotein n=1 Tax=Streptomyces albipurpureus TaxID=2897419 RepID=A0ABT0UMB7_9ACTN|nr:hypothetical protein [Streptomyces sp. CWNU-1]MCM2389772.1 hypothetical protein [Streptomyces sp. CWNU-1]